MRLDQFLVQSNICSRREVKELIKKGRVSVDGDMVKDSALHILEGKACVRLDGRQIVYEKFRYYMLNKPQGVVTAVSDAHDTTVVDLLRAEGVKNLFPVGRLDKDTEGLLLITDDGQLSHNLLSPRKHVDKVYQVTSDRLLTSTDMEKLEKGVDIGDDRVTLPSEIESLDENSAQYLLTIHEGRFHQVKRMFEAVGAKVIFLKRISMGPLVLDDKLKAGEYRRLTEEEISLLAEYK